MSNRKYFSEYSFMDENKFIEGDYGTTTTTGEFQSPLNYKFKQYASPMQRSRNITYKDEFENEPSLLEELEIYPIRIIEKSLVILNPFHSRGFSDDPEYLFKETDLAGPILFCITFAFCLFLTGHEANFSYIYGLSVISVILMYSLITLMCNSNENFITLSGVASILGYSILPIVWIGIIGILITLKSFFGIILIVSSIYLSTKGSSKILCLMIKEPEQRYLIGYPCALVYIIFSLLLIF